MGNRTSRREFIKKSGMIRGLGAAGALALKKEYVKPVVMLLERDLAYAQPLTPAGNIVATSATFSVSPMNVTLGQTATTLALVLDMPGASPPAPGQSFNASVSITNMADMSGWGSGIFFPVGDTRTSDVIDNAGMCGMGGSLAFTLDLAQGTLNGTWIVGPQFPPPPHTWGSVMAVMSRFLSLGVSGDMATLCINVDADAGITMHGTPYSGHHVGTSCVQAIRS